MHRPPSTVLDPPIRFPSLPGMFVGALCACASRISTYIYSQKLYFQNETTSCSYNMSSTPLLSSLPHAFDPYTETVRNSHPRSNKTINTAALPPLASGSFHLIAPDLFAKCPFSSHHAFHKHIPHPFAYTLPPPSYPYSRFPPFLLSPPLPTPKQHSTHVTVQGSGMQQHSYPSHSMHFVRSACWLVPGGRWFTGVARVEDAMFDGSWRC